MYNEKPKSPLIVDIDENFIAKLESDPKGKTVKPYFAKTGKEAQLLMSDPKIELAGIFVNPALPTEKNSPSWVSVVKFARRHRVSVPVYVLSDPSAEVNVPELEALGVREVVKKPVSLGQILDMIAPQVVFFDDRARPKEVNEKLDQEMTLADAEFIPIIAKNFTSGSTSMFSVYVRTGSGRYIKVLHANDAFDPTRVQSYISKGVENFYIRKNDQELYVKYNGHLSTKVIVDNILSVSAQAGITMNYGEETLKFLAEQGVSETRLYHAASFAKNIQEVAKKMSTQGEFMSSLLKDIERYEHGVALTMITSLIGRESGIESSKAVEIVGIASLLHDIGLAGTKPGLENMEVAKMSEDDKKAFYAHPKKGADIMLAIPGTHATIIQAIHYHHERKGTRTGFDPTQPRPKGVSGIAEIIGIADEYLKLIDRYRSDRTLDIRAYLQKEVFRGFSIDTVDAFAKALYPNRSSRPKNVA